MRPVGGWSVLLARVSSMGDHAASVRRTGLALVGLLTVVLGWWGFRRYSGQYPDAGMGWPEWLYGMWLPIGGAILMLRYIQLAIRNFIKAKGEESK